MFLKPLSDVSYDDIERLKQNQTEESDILDYKECMIDVKAIIKHVCAFANTRGGYLIFGIKESGDGGHPVEIKGVNSNLINKERIENLILSHVTPRLTVGIKTVQIPESEKSILIIKIPDSFARPHYDIHEKRFYKRFNFKSETMTEQEIADLYKRRFSSHVQIDQYVEKILSDKRSNTIIENIVIIPSNIEHRLLDTFDFEKFQWMDNIQLEKHNGGFGRSIVPYRPIPCSYGLTHMKQLDNRDYA